MIWVFQEKYNWWIIIIFFFCNSQLNLNISIMVAKEGKIHHVYSWSMYKHGGLAILHIPYLAPLMWLICNIAALTIIDNQGVGLLLCSLPWGLQGFSGFCLVPHGYQHLCKVSRRGHLETGWAATNMQKTFSSIFLQTPGRVWELWTSAWRLFWNAR